MLWGKCVIFFSLLMQKYEEEKKKNGKKIFSWNSVVSGAYVEFVHCGLFIDIENMFYAIDNVMHSKFALPYSNANADKTLQQ